MKSDSDDTNLLKSALITVRLTDESTAACSLPDLYALLMADRVEAITALRPHQKHPLHAFLAQVGALALMAADRTQVPDDSATWRDLLRGLTPKYPDDAPWTLVVPDLDKPAFMQPPVPEGSLASLRDVEVTPDTLDMLVTSKNHDLKAQRMRTAAPDEWLFALITLQTSEGFLGAGNYGISRMNGGFASRPSVGISPPGGIGRRIRRDIERLVSVRDGLLKEYPGYPARGGLGLVWLRPWDGTTQLVPKDLDPFYVEVCRRIRFSQINDQIVAHRGSSKCARIAFPKGYAGVTGDPWTPIDRDAAKALTIDGNGFHYRRVVDLMASVLTPTLGSHI